MNGNKNGMPRRYKFIDSPQQLKFSVDIVLHALLFPMLVAFLLYFEPFSTWLVRGDVVRGQDVVLAFLRLCVANWWVPAIALLVVGVISILFSHKIFGPILRLRMNVERVQRGEQEVAFRLRPGDYFHDFADVLGEYVQGVEAELSGEVDQAPDRTSHVSDDSA